MVRMNTNGVLNSKNSCQIVYKTHTCTCIRNHMHPMHTHMHTKTTTKHKAHTALPLGEQRPPQ